MTERNNKCAFCPNESSERVHVQTLPNGAFGGAHFEYDVCFRCFVRMGTVTRLEDREVSK